MQQVRADQGLYQLLPGELAIWEGTAGEADSGIALITLNKENYPSQIIPYIGDLAGVYIDEETLQAGDVFVYDPDAGPAQKGGWVNAPAPPPDLVGNSIFDLGDVSSGLGIQTGNTLGWSGGMFRPAKSPEQAIVGDLADVQLQTPSDGQTLVWRDQLGFWTNEYLPDTLGSLVDVDLETNIPVDGDVLIYNDQRDLWEAGAVAGGNANVEVIDPDQPFPEVPFRTLGVSPITDIGTEDEAGGDFYWVQDEATSTWGKALREGEVDFGDFKDVSTEGIQPGQTLVNTFNGTGYSYAPASIAQPGFIYREDAEFTQNMFSVSYNGEEGAGGYAMTTQVTDEFNSQQRFLEVHGQREDGSKPVITYEMANEVERWERGVWDFTGTNMLPGPTGMRGFRPFSSNEGWDVIGGKEEFSAGIEVWLTKNFLTCRLIDLGSLVVEMVNGIVQATVKVNGSTYSTANGSNGTVPTNQRVWLYVRITDNRIRTYINGTDILGSVQLPAGATADPIDGSEAVPVPSFLTQGEFQGYVGQMMGAGNDTNYDDQPTYLANWPTVNGPGRLVQMITEQRLIGWEYSEDSHGTVAMAHPYIDFGRSVKLMDLADVDAASFYNAEYEGLVKWDPTQQRFVHQPLDEVEWQGFYRITDASDVSTRTDSNTNVEDGMILAWSDTRNTWRPIGNDLAISVNDAADVDILAGDGLSQGSILRWDAGTSKWQPALAPEAYPIELGELTNVDLEFTQLVDGDTLLYSEALDAWVAAPLPGRTYSTLESLEDTELELVKNRDILQYDGIKQKWVNADNPDPVVLDDLGDVELIGQTISGQALQWVDGAWRAGAFANFSAQGIEDLIDVDARNPRPGEALLWNGAKWKNTPIAAGRGDGGDFDTTFTGTGFVSGVFGGGDFDTDAADLPIERLAPFLGGGDFD